jgi:RND family efflux transporter MFP subunit
MKKKVIIISSIVFIFLVLILFQVFNKQEPEISLAEVVKEDITEKISVTGSLIPLKRIDLEVDRQGKIEEVVVEVGDVVEAETPLIYLDNEEESINLQKAQANLTKAQYQINLSEIQLTNAIKNLEKVKARTQQSIQKAESDLITAETNLTAKKQNLEDVQRETHNDLKESYEDARSDLASNFLVGDEALLKIDNIRNSYFSSVNQIGAKIKSKRDIAYTDLNNTNTLITEAQLTEDPEKTLTALISLRDSLGLIKETLSYIRQEGFETPPYKSTVSDTDRTAIDTQKTNVEAAINDLITAEQAIESQKITNTSSLNTAQSQLDSAQASVDAAQSNLEYVEAQREETISQTEATIDQTQKELALNQAQASSFSADVAQARMLLKRMTLKAPLAGTITKVELEEGETAKPGQVAVTMMPNDNFKIEADVSEVDIGKIKIKDKIEVDFDAYPGEQYLAKVSKIYPAEIVKEGVIYYRIEVLLDSYPQKLKSGLTANLDIITGQAKGVLTVPYVAIKQEEDKNYVRVMKANNKIEKREVSLGLEGETRVEIKKGLQENEQVITFIED